MATANGRAVRTTIVKQDKVDEAMTFLKELPDKPKEDMSLREAVGHLRDEIKDALGKGYSYADLAKMLTDQGIKISALTLKITSLPVSVLVPKLKRVEQEKLKVKQPLLHLRRNRNRLHPTLRNHVVGQKRLLLMPLPRPLTQQQNQPRNDRQEDEQHPQPRQRQKLAVEPEQNKMLLRLIRQRLRAADAVKQVVSPLKQSGSTKVVRILSC